MGDEVIEFAEAVGATDLNRLFDYSSFTSVEGFLKKQGSPDRRLKFII